MIAARESKNAATGTVPIAQCESLESLCPFFRLTPQDTLGDGDSATGTLRRGLYQNYGAEGL